MTKLEELKAASDAAYHACDAVFAVYAAARDADAAASDAAYHAWIAYQAELKKTKEQTND